MNPPSSIEPRPTESQSDSDSTHAAAPSLTSSSPWRDAVLALSIAHFSLIQAAHGQLYERTFAYFSCVPVSRASLAALLLNILALGLVLWIAGRLVRRINSGIIFSLASLAICAAPIIPFNFVRTHFWDLNAAKVTPFLKQPLVMIAAVTIVIAALWFHRRVAKVLMVIYMILSPMVLFTAGTIGWHFIRSPTAAHDIVTASSAVRVASPRIVWLVLDELDQRIAFEQRPSDIAMPELSRFYNENFRATNAFPPGGSTTYSMPGLTIGREVRRNRIISSSELAFDGIPRWSQTDTVFARARSLGFSTALVGWFHPYGRVLGHQLDRCEWVPYSPLELERGLTFKEAAINQLCSIVPQFQQRRLHIKNFMAAETAAVKFLTDSPAALTLLHLPGPHLPGIYDAKRGQFTAWKYSRTREYLENLALTDRQFGTLRRAMEQARTWDTTWVIVTSDHWWRESAQYDGKTDHRVPFIIKAPGENKTAIYDKKFDTVLTYHLLLSILKGELSSAAELPHWLDMYRTDPPAGYKTDGEPL